MGKPTRTDRHEQNGQARERTEWTSTGEAIDWVPRQSLDRVFETNRAILVYSNVWAAEDVSGSGW